VRRGRGRELDANRPVASGDHDLTRVIQDGMTDRVDVLDRAVGKNDAKLREEISLCRPGRLVPSRHERRVVRMHSPEERCGDR